MERSHTARKALKLQYFIAVAVGLNWWDSLLEPA